MRIAEAQIVRALGELKEESKFSSEKLVQSLLALLKRKRMLRRMGKVFRAIDRYEEETAGVVQVHATSAHPLSPDVRKIVELQAQKLFSKNSGKTTVVFQEDRNLLGGVKLESSNTQYDFSLARALKELRKSL